MSSFNFSCSIGIGIRLSANYFSKEEAKTIKQKEFTLLNIPYFHAAKLELYVEVGLLGLIIMIITI